MTDNAEVRS